MELIHGDCLVEMDSIVTGSVDMVMADPPYGISRDSGISNSKLDKYYSTTISNIRRQKMSEKKKWNDYVIDAEGDPNPDGSGEVDIVEQGFACPDCGSLLPALSDQGIAGCSSCLALWQRDGSEIVGLDREDFEDGLYE